MQADFTVPTQTDWYIEKHVIRFHFYGNVSEQDIIHSQASLRDFIDAAEPPLFLLIDALDADKLPTTFRSLLPGMQAYRDGKQITRTLVVTNSALLGFFGALATKLLGMQVQLYGAMDEVEPFLARYFPEQIAAMGEAQREIDTAKDERFG